MVKSKIPPGYMVKYALLTHQKYNAGAFLRSVAIRGIQMLINPELVLANSVVAVN